MTLDRRPALFPYFATDLLGRAADLAAITQLLVRHRCVKLTGQSGAGKTRLLQQLMVELREEYAQGEGICFVSLSAIVDPRLVLPTIAQVLGVRENAGRNLAASLVADIGNQNLLLLLDNVEQVAGALDDVALLLQACAGLRVVLTSRVSLPKPYGAEYSVLPLAVPDLQDLPDLPDLLAFASVALFVERAEEAYANFRVTTANSCSIAELCVMLGGLPLAIELAAAQSSRFTPADMIDYLRDAEHILIDRQNLVADRVQTAVAWSVSLLGGREQAVLLCLSSFEGAFYLEDATAVCTTVVSLTDEQPPMAIGTPQISALIEAGLVQPVYSSSGDHVFNLLEPVREYAVGLLRQSPIEAETRQRHAGHFADLAKRAHSELRGAQQAQWLERLVASQPNLRAALRHLIDIGDMDLAATTAGYLARFWNFGGALSEGRRWLDEILVYSISDDAARARALLGTGALAWLQADYNVAEKSFAECLHIYTHLKDHAGVYATLGNLGAIEHIRGNYRHAMRYYTISAQRARANKDWSINASALNNLGMLALAIEQYSRATDYFTQSLKLYVKLEDSHNQAIVLNNLGSVSLEAGFIEAAQNFYSRGLKLLVQIEDKGRQAEALEGLAAVAAKKGQYRYAAYLWGHANSLREQAQTPHITPKEREIYSHFVDEARQNVNALLWQEQWQAGQNAATAEIIAIALRHDTVA